MTDDQLLKIILIRAAKAAKSSNASLKDPRLVLTQQYGKKLYFALKFDGSIIPYRMSFSKNGTKQVFVLPELPERLMDWKHETIKKIYESSSLCNYVDFDIHAAPKEVVHIFFSAIISALNTPGMSVGLMVLHEDIFGPDETYEEIQIEADLMEFNNDQCF